VWRLIWCSKKKNRCFVLVFLKLSSTSFLGCHAVSHRVGANAFLYFLMSAQVKQENSNMLRRWSWNSGGWSELPICPLANLEMIVIDFVQGRQRLLVKKDSGCKLPCRSKSLSCWMRQHLVISLAWKRSTLRFQVVRHVKSNSLQVCADGQKGVCLFTSCYYAAKAQRIPINGLPHLLSWMYSSSDKKCFSMMGALVCLCVTWRMAQTQSMTCMSLSPPGALFQIGL